MKVLLLHPEDEFSTFVSANRWDLVVDLGRAPAATYDRWGRQPNCEVFSVYRFAEEIEDLHRIRRLLQIGLGHMVDRSGVDWWDLLSLFVAGDLQQIMLAHRLSTELGSDCELYSTRATPLAKLLQKRLGVRVTVLDNRFRAAVRRLRHGYNIFSRLDAAQVVQVLEDKFDGRHAIRHHFAPPIQHSGQPVVLLPSAYINVSRTALSYAAALPELQFLLVLTRSAGKLRSLPPNARLASLTPYFVPTDEREIAALLESWSSLRDRLTNAAEEFNSAHAIGVFARIPALLRWGIALRDAWFQVFEHENVIACLSADDSNPPSSIPLIMAKQRGLPALACHHGALDYQMAMKINHADSYLVKSEMERDYLIRICRLHSEKIMLGAPSPGLAKLSPVRSGTPWLVFFSEPYENAGWRSEEVCRDLLPRLYTLAESCGLKLVLKIHPFESVKRLRQILRRHLPEHERQIEVIAGAPSNQLWRNTRFALTVQSTTAVECAVLGIPVFLCGWLRDPYSGYVQQFDRFGVGPVLESPDEIAEIPRLLEMRLGASPVRDSLWRTIDAERLGHLFSNSYSLPVASNS